MQNDFHWKNATDCRTVIIYRFQPSCGTTGADAATHSTRTSLGANVLEVISYTSNYRFDAWEWWEWSYGVRACYTKRREPAIKMEPWRTIGSRRIKHGNDPGDSDPPPIMKGTGWYGIRNSDHHKMTDAKSIWPLPADQPSRLVS